MAALSFRIRRGPLQGARWTLTGGGKLFRLWQGDYEPEQTALFRERVGEGAVIYDVGAHAGYYSLLASRRVGPSGQVVAFEAFPRNAAALRRHLTLNGCANVQVEEVAVAGEAGERRFRPGKGSGTGALTGGGAPEADPGVLVVPAVTLDGYLREHPAPPAVIKIDVEGAEAEVLAGAEGLLREHHPTLFLSLHGEAARRDCRRILEGQGYRFTAILGDDLERSDELLCEWSPTPTP